MNTNTSYMSEGARARAMQLAVELRETGATHNAIGKALYRKIGYASYKSGKALTGSAVFSLLKEAKDGSKKKVSFKRKNPSDHNLKNNVRTVLSIQIISDKAKLAVLKEMVGLA